jgi:hypothetical protein
MRNYILGRSLKLLSPENDLLLLEVPPVFLVHQHQVYMVLHAESFIYILVGRSQVRRCQVEPDRDALALHWSSVHHLKLRQVLLLRDCVLPRAYHFLLDDVELHVLNLDPHQVEEYLPQNAVLHSVHGPCKLELNMQAVFDSYFHLDGLVRLGGLLNRVENDELLFFIDSAAVASVDDHVDIVSTN